MGLLDLIRQVLSVGRAEAAPVIAEPYKRGFDRDFRRPGDPAHVVRVNQKAPKGLPKKLLEYVPVAGVSHEPAHTRVISFIAGTARSVDLERDPTNAHDPNAIKVIGSWRDVGGEEQRARIGWLPADVAKKIAEAYPDMPIGATLETMYRPSGRKGAGLRLDIWCPRGTRTRSFT